MKLKRLFAGLLAMLAVSANSMAQETGEYLLYSEADHAFVSRGSNWNTRAIIDKCGVQVKWDANAKTFTFLDTNKLLFLTKDNLGFYTDWNNNGITTWTTIDKGDGTYLIKNDGGKYLSVSKVLNSVTKKYDLLPVDTEEDATAWTFVALDNKAAYLKKIADANAASVAASYSVDGISTKDELDAALANADNFFTIDLSDQLSADFPTSGTVEKYQQANDERNDEYYFTQTLTNLGEGIYKIKFGGFERFSSYQNCNNLDEAHNYIYTQLYFGDQSVALKKWISEKEGTNNPNNQPQALTAFNNGKYVNEVYAYVSAGGELSLKLQGHTSTWTSQARWVCVGNYSLTKYIKKKPAAELIEEAEALNSSAMNAATKTTLTTALATFNDNQTLEEAYNALVDAIEEAKQSAASYATAKAALDNTKAIYDANTFASASAKTTFETAYNAQLTAYNGGTLTNEDAANMTNIIGGFTSEWKSSSMYATPLITYFGSAWNGNGDNIYVNFWSVEGDTDGSNFKVPFIEYFTDNANSLGAKTISGVIEDEAIKRGTTYDLSLTARIQAKTSATPVEGSVMLNFYGNKQSIVATEGNSNFKFANYTVSGMATEDGKMSVSIEVAAESNVHWLSFQNISYKVSENQVTRTEEESDALIAEAQSLVGSNMQTTVQVAMQDAVAELEADKTNALKYADLDAAVTAAKASIAAYSNAKAYFEDGGDALAIETFENNAIATIENKITWTDAYEGLSAKYLNREMTTEEASADFYYTLGIKANNWNETTNAKAQATTIAQYLANAWAEGTQKPVVNTWSVEGNNDGSNFKVPFLQCWINDAQQLAAGTVAATVDGLVPGQAYVVTVKTRLRMTNNKDAFVENGVTLQANGGTAVDVTKCVSITDNASLRLYVGDVTAYGTADEEGKVTVTFNIAENSNVSWLSIKASSYYQRFPITINEGKTATTIGSEYALDFTDAEGIKAYTVSEINGSYAKMEQVTGAVPANTGLVITAGTPGTYYAKVTQEAATLAGTNYLEAVTTETKYPSDASNTYYVYGALNGVEGFYKAAGYTVPAGKAVLKVPVSQYPAKAAIYLNGGATGVAEVEAGADTDSEPIYNVCGQRISKAKGLVIKGGKKYFVK